MRRRHLATFSQQTSTSISYTRCKTVVTTLPWPHHMDTGNGQHEMEANLETALIMGPRIKILEVSGIFRPYDARFWDFGFKVLGCSRLRDSQLVAGTKGNCGQQLTRWNLELRSGFWSRWPKLRNVRMRLCGDLQHSLYRSGVNRRDSGYS